MRSARRWRRRTAVPPGKLLTLAGKTLVSTVGGASGPLWGTAFRRAGRALGDAEEFDGQDLLAALRAALDGVVELGAAQPGDKTMVDALDPRSTPWGVIEAGEPLEAALAAASAAAEEGHGPPCPAGQEGPCLLPGRALDRPPGPRAPRRQRSSWPRFSGRSSRRADERAGPARRSRVARARGRARGCSPPSGASAREPVADAELETEAELARAALSQAASELERIAAGLRGADATRRRRSSTPAP